MKYKHKFEKYYFNPELNDLEVDFNYIIETKISLKRDKDYRDYFLATLAQTMLYVVIILLVGWGISSQSVIGAIIIDIILGSITIVIGVCFALFNYYCDDKSILIDLYKDVEEYQKLQAHNLAELDAMENWRARHPFEEMVRKAMKSKNSNDVADVIKMILERDTI